MNIAIRVVSNIAQIDDFFMYENRVEGITDADYQRAQPYVEAAQAFAQTTYQSIYIIDTPGIRGFGTFDIEKEELTSYFKEIFHFSKDCRFSNCTHTHEPGCAVLQAIEDHLIAPSRYQSYLSILADKDDSKYRAAY